jgi:hypothetical protein
MACKKADIKLVKYLIAHGADIHHNEDDLLKIVCINGTYNTEVL